MFKKYFEVFWVFLRLGFTSFGGPIAHLSYFHDEFVSRRKWINEHAYADLVALCQFLPGPASSQVGIAVGLNRAGILGAIVAWIGFTLPSAIILILFGLGISKFSVSMDAGWLHSLKVVAVAVVAQAIWGMGVKLCPDKERMTITGVACILTGLIPSGWMQIGVIILGGIAGVFSLRSTATLPHVPVEIPLSKRQGTFFLTLFVALLLVLPPLSEFSGSHGLKMFDSFYRAGSLVFGGGHVVLPLLQAEVVPTGWVSNDAFMAGYGAAQAIPGPLFTFTAYLGAVSSMAPNAWSGAVLCLIAAFLPAFLLVLGVLPFWEKLRGFKNMRYAMLGINAAVVGLLIAAFYHPVWTSGITNIKDFSLALGGFILLAFWRMPSWAVVLLSATMGALFL
ncbi:MAG: chromate efflux transporter [Pseudobdellovibrionaceae bacterium]